MSSDYAKFAAAIAENYGPYLTKAMKGDGIEELKSMFSSPVHVVLQNSEGDEMVFTIGDEDNASMTWLEFQQVSSQDLSQQDYLQTESECLGVLGNRLILEIARLNQAGEAYLAAYALVEFNDEGKITDFESFSDLKTTTLTG